MSARLNITVLLAASSLWFLGHLLLEGMPHAIASAIAHVLLVGGAIAVCLLVIAWHETGRLDVFMLFRPRRYERFSFWFSGVYACFVSALVAAGMWAHDGLSIGSMTLTTAVFTLCTALHFTIWGVLLTYHVLRRQHSAFSGFESLLSQLTERLAIANKADNHTDVFICDYHPLMGTVSAQGRQLSDYTRELEKACFSPNVSVNIVCYGREAIPSFLERLRVESPSEAHDARTRLEDGLLEIEKAVSQARNTRITYSRDVGAPQFVVIGGVAFEYFVVPEDDSRDSKHTLFGYNTEEVFRVASLRRLYEHRRKRAIAPAGISYDGCSDGFYIDMVPQFGVERVEVYGHAGAGQVEASIEPPSMQFAGEDLLRVSGYFVPRSVVSGLEEVQFGLVFPDSNVGKARPISRRLFDTLTRARRVCYLLSRGDDAESELWRNAAQFSQENPDLKPIKITVFSAVPVDASEARNSWECPITVVGQAPEDGDVALEVLWLDRRVDSESEVVYERAGRGRSSVRCTVVRRDDEPMEVFFSVSGTNYSQVLRRASGVLEGRGLSLENSLRHWHYIEDILEVGSDGVQVYQRFNHARAEVFEGLFAGAYPAASALGASHGAYTLEVIAGAGFGVHPLSIDALFHPRDYSGDVLPGAPVIDGGEMARPLFSRGLSLRNGADSRVLVSGTSAVRGEATVSQVQRNSTYQTEIALANVLEVLSEHIGERVSSLAYNIDYLRVYVSADADMSQVRQVIERQVDELVPRIYLRCDICRAGLTVELDCGVL